MIHDAFGQSRLDEEARALAKILSLHSDAASIEASAADWAVSAFRSAGADEVHVQKFGPSSQFENVVAGIRGREHLRDYVLVAAFLTTPRTDSLSTAENAAVLIDAIRVIHATGNIPRRSIRVVLFGTPGGNARGRLEGVWAYIHRPGAEPDRIAAALTLDAAGETPDGYSLEDRPDTLAATRQALEPLRSLGIHDFAQNVRIPTEVTPFWLQGIPTLVAIPDGVSGLNGNAGTPGSIDPARLQQLKRQVAIAAVTAYALADADSRIGRRKTISEVRNSIESLGLEPQLKAAGLWDEWQASQSDASH